MTEWRKCADRGRRTHSCDAASHDYVTLYGRTILQDEFAVPHAPVAATLYMMFNWSCFATDWYFFEGDNKDYSNDAIGLAHRIEPKIDEADWNLIRHWVDGCLQGHNSDCTNADEIELPGFELIDCKTRKLVPGTKGAEFAALSYVWGSPQTLEVPPDLLDLSDRTTLPNPFPEKVIEDALACANKLKIPYLWVDRYCIDQKDTSDTKQHLIQSMGKIYSAAKVTIINVAGDNASTGLPGVSTTLRAQYPSSAVIYGGNFVPVTNPKNSIMRSKWATRGWTLQESLLARRRLVFTDTQVYFQCTQAYCIESVLAFFRLGGNVEDGYELDTYSHDPRVAVQAFPSSFGGSYRSSYSIANVCNEFAKRDLTTDDDALKACLGIFSRLWARGKPAYQYCGLPFQANSETAFAVALLWKFNHDFPNHPSPTRRTWGPSWSWIAWMGYMFFNRGGWDNDYDNYQLRVDIKIPVQREEQKIMSTINDYIQDIDGGGLYQHWLPYLQLSGWTTTLRFDSGQGEFDYPISGSVTCSPASGQDNIGKGEILPAMWAKVASNGHPSKSSRLLSIIVIAYEELMCLHCLVIRRIGEEKANEYERLGTCQVRCGSPEIKEAQGTGYIKVRDARTGIERDLECRRETITLV